MVDHSSMYEEPLSASRQLLCPLVLFGAGEYVRQFSHRERLGMKGRCMACHLSAQVQQHLRNVDLDRANFVAGPAQGGSVGQAFGSLYTHQLWCENSTDRAGVDRAIGMTARAGIDRADIEAGATADAVQRLTTHIVGEDLRAPIVKQYQVEALRAISWRHSRPQTCIRIHPFSRRAARQQLQEDGKVPERGQNLLDTHHRDKGLRQGYTHTPIALALHDADRPRFSYSEICAAQSYLCREELLSQIAPRHGGKALGVVREILSLSDRATEEVAYLGSILVNGRD